MHTPSPTSTYGQASLFVVGGGGQCAGRWRTPRSVVKSRWWCSWMMTRTRCWAISQLLRVLRIGTLADVGRSVTGMEDHGDCRPGDGRAY